MVYPRYTQKGGSCENPFNKSCISSKPTKSNETTNTKKKRRKSRLSSRFFSKKKKNQEKPIDDNLKDDNLKDDILKLCDAYFINNIKPITNIKPTTSPNLEQKIDSGCGFLSTLEEKKLLDIISSINIETKYPNEKDIIQLLDFIDVNFNPNRNIIKGDSCTGDEKYYLNFYKNKYKEGECKESDTNPECIGKIVSTGLNTYTKISPSSTPNKTIKFDKLKEIWSPTASQGNTDSDLMMNRLAFDPDTFKVNNKKAGTTLVDQEKILRIIQKLVKDDKKQENNKLYIRIDRSQASKFSMESTVQNIGKNNKKLSDMFGDSACNIFQYGGKLDCLYKNISPSLEPEKCSNCNPQIDLSNDSNYSITIKNLETHLALNKNQIGCINCLGKLNEFGKGNGPKSMEKLISSISKQCLKLPENHYNHLNLYDNLVYLFKIDRNENYSDREHLISELVEIGYRYSCKMDIDIKKHLREMIVSGHKFNSEKNFIKFLYTFVKTIKGYDVIILTPLISNEYKLFYEQRSIAFGIVKTHLDESKYASATLASAKPKPPAPPEIVPKPLPKKGNNKKVNNSVKTTPGKTTPGKAINGKTRPTPGKAKTGKATATPGKANTGKANTGKATATPKPTPDKSLKEYLELIIKDSVREPNISILKDYITKNMKKLTSFTFNNELLNDTDRGRMFLMLFVYMLKKFIEIFKGISKMDADLADKALTEVNDYLQKLNTNIQGTRKSKRKDKKQIKYQQITKFLDRLKNNINLFCKKDIDNYINILKAGLDNMFNIGNNLFTTFFPSMFSNKPELKIMQNISLDKVKTTIEREVYNISKKSNDEKEQLKVDDDYTKKFCKTKKKGVIKSWLRSKKVQGKEGKYTSNLHQPIIDLIELLKIFVSKLFKFSNYKSGTWNEGSFTKDNKKIREYSIFKNTLFITLYDNTKIIKKAKTGIKTKSRNFMLILDRLTNYEEAFKTRKTKLINKCGNKKTVFCNLIKPK